MKQDQADLDKQARKHRGKRKAAEDSLERLRDAYLDGLFTMDEFKKKQAMLKRDLAAIDAAIGVGRVRWEDIERTLNLALMIASDLEQIYLRSNSAGRRLLNQGVFAKIRVDTDDDATAEASGPFAWLLDEDFPAELDAHTNNAADPEERRRWNEFRLARPARFELATPWFEAKYSNPLSYGRVVCCS